MQMSYAEDKEKKRPESLRRTDSQLMSYRWFV